MGKISWEVAEDMANHPELYDTVDDQEPDFGA